MILESENSFLGDPYSSFSSSSSSDLAGAERSFDQNSLENDQNSIRSLKSLKNFNAIESKCPEKNPQKSSRFSKQTRYEPTYPNPIQSDSLPWEKFPDGLMKRCSDGERIDDETKKAIRDVLANYQITILEDRSHKMSVNIAAALVGTYLKSFGDRVDKRIVDHLPHLSFAKELARKIRYLTEKEKKSFATSSETETVEDDTSQEQEEANLRKIWLSGEGLKDDEEKLDEQKIIKGLEVTLKMRRKELRMTKSFLTFFKEWPILKKPVFFIEHCKLMTNKKEVLQDFEKCLTENYDKLIKFYKSKFSKAQDKIRRHPKTREKSEQVLSRAKKIIEDADEATTKISSIKSNLIAAFQLICLHFNEDFLLLFKVKVNLL